METSKKGVKTQISVVLAMFICMTLFSLQVFSVISYEPDFSQIITKRQSNIVELLSFDKQNPSFENNYFTLSLPVGMSLYAIDNNNFKARFDNTFFEVHIFVSKIDSESYSKLRFGNTQKITLPNTKLFCYLQPLGNDFYEYGLYTDKIEVTANIHISNLEVVFLKSIELINGITVLENENSVYIGGNTTPQPQGDSGEFILGSEVESSNGDEKMLPINN